MVYTYVINGVPIDFNYIRKELIRLDKFKEYQSWLDKTYLGIYQNRTYLLLFITFMIRKIFARRGVDRFDLVNIHNEKLRLVFGGNHRLIKKIITILILELELMVIASVFFHLNRCVSHLFSGKTEKITPHCLKPSTRQFRIFAKNNEFFRNFVFFFEFGTLWMFLLCSPVIMKCLEAQ